MNELIKGPLMKLAVWIVVLFAGLELVPILLVRLGVLEPRAERAFVRPEPKTGLERAADLESRNALARSTIGSAAAINLQARDRYDVTSTQSASPFVPAWTTAFVPVVQYEEDDGALVVAEDGRFIEKPPAGLRWSIHRPLMVNPTPAYGITSPMRGIMIPCYQPLASDNTTNPNGVWPELDGSGIIEGWIPVDMVSYTKPERPKESSPHWSGFVGPGEVVRTGIGIGRNEAVFIRVMAGKPENLYVRLRDKSLSESAPYDEGWTLVPDLNWVTKDGRPQTAVGAKSSIGADNLQIWNRGGASVRLEVWKEHSGH